ncbi:MAG: hypothetical protein ABI367_08630 [Mucilaginibacter sp.]
MYLNTCTTVKYLVCVILLFVLSHGVYAQSTLKGQIFDNATKAIIPKVKVTNIKKQRSAVADSLGRFAIEAAPGDRIVYTAPTYLADTVYLVNLNTVKVYLQPNQTQLNEVKVQSARTHLGQLVFPSAPGPFGGQTVKYTTDDHGNQIGGLTLKLFTPAKTKQKAASARKIEREETQNAIAKIFSAQNLKNYIDLDGQELQNFSILYMPPVEVYQHNFNLALYIDSCRKEFMKIPIEKRRSKEFLELH